MAEGVELSQEDSEDVAKLFKVRYSAIIRNWNERGVDGCLWFVSCPNLKNEWVTQTGTSLSDTIMNLLKELSL